MTKINCFIPFAEKEQAQKTIDGFKSSALVNKIYLLAGADVQGTVEGCEVIKVNNLNASATMRAIADKADADFVLLYTKYDTLKFAPYAIDRFVQIAQDSQSGMLYADLSASLTGAASSMPTITM